MRRARRRVTISDQEGVLLPPSDDGGTGQTEHLRVGQAPVAKVVADTVHLEQACAGSIICERAEMNQSFAATLESDSATLVESAAASLRGQEVHLQSSAAGAIVAEKVAASQVSCAFLSAQTVEGEVTCLIDQWWLAALGGAALGIAFGVTAWLLSRGKD